MPCRYEERQKARAEEIKGCSEALAILSSVPGFLGSSVGDHVVQYHVFILFRIDILAFNFGSLGRLRGESRIPMHARRQGCSE